MTLDEAIKHCHEKAEEIRKANEEMPTECKLSEDLCECAKEHEQLAEWLEELKALKECKGDLISREALKEALNFVYDCAYINSKSKEGIVSDIIDEINNAPTVGTTVHINPEAVKWNGGDLISREALRELEPHYSEDGYRVFYEYEIDNAPTVDIPNCTECSYRIQINGGDLSGK